ncbi:MAG: helix-turn-helix transcriptional regulator [Oscillospiraceae bacterium]|nr:helix-turn-helix transcriptional regulator [Oscillospiraceae bacterium]
MKGYGKYDRNTCLRYSDKSAAAISSYLGFSSQSHFSRVFRKYFGKTPAEYRDKYQR